MEKLQRMSDPVLTDCPECGKAKLQRLISAAGFRLKGAGWYETDFKQGNKRNLAESPGGDGASGKESSAGAGGGEAAKAETPAAKSDGAAKKTAPGGGSEAGSGAAAKKTPGSGRAADPA